MNSLLAFSSIKPTLNHRQLVVLDAMKTLGCPVSMHEVATFLNVPLHTISGRFGELVKKGKLRIVGGEMVKGSRRSLYEVAFIDDPNPEPGLAQAHGEATSPVFGGTASGGRNITTSSNLTGLAPARHMEVD